MMTEKKKVYFNKIKLVCTLQNENIAVLRDFFGDRVISLRTQTMWPSRSCDLTPCDFFLWPHLKNCIFKTPDVDDLRIVNKIKEINNTPRILHINVIKKSYAV